MKSKMFDTHGNKSKDIELPKVFSEKIREDMVARVLETIKSMQPYSPSPVAGKQHSASGKTVHRRHVWRSGYGRGMSRIPRKIFTQKGSQFIWAGAEVASVRGGRRAHPPKVTSMINIKKVNKKEISMALASGISATANKKYVSARYKSLSGKEKELSEIPFILESGFLKLKTKEMLTALKKILGKELFEIAIRKKSVRSGKGKLRGRRYKSTAGLLLVTGSNENFRTNLFETKSAKNLGVKDVANGGLGRLVAYTEEAVKEIENKFEKPMLK